MKKILLLISLFSSLSLSQSQLQLNDLEYFDMPGLNVMLFHDFYPEGHQGGVTVIQHGERVAANGDLRLEPTPGQWQPLPKPGKRTIDREHNLIRINLAYPDSSRNRQGFNPMIYPELILRYQISVQATNGSSFRIRIDLEEPLPKEWVGRIGFNLELFPAALFGKSWYLDENSGIFPQQANGPVQRDPYGELQVVPLAQGRRLTIAPETQEKCMVIESKIALQLIDGRANHNNGWFIVRSLIDSGATTSAVDWLVTPHTVPDWIDQPVVHISQIGFHPQQEKRAVIELDQRDAQNDPAELLAVLPQGGTKPMLTTSAKSWGKFLRYRYLIFDFSQIRQPGLYQIKYGKVLSHVFRIDDQVYSRHVWQPTLEYFMPVQMCHMRVNEKYRVWHGLCHMDDALMAPVNNNHFDGYRQGAQTLSAFKPLQHVPDLNLGGWHDAGDYDLRIESQAGTVWIMAAAYEAFQPMDDQTLIDQEKRVVEIHQPDGKPDLLQQIEHGVLTLLAGYRQFGRLYRGIICPTLRQYVLLGDAAVMTDGKIYEVKGKEREYTGLWFTRVANKYSQIYDPLGAYNEVKEHADALDDRLVFTEENPNHALDGAAALAAAGRVLKSYDAKLADECQQTAEKLWQANEFASGRGTEQAKIKALVELILSTDRLEYKNALIALLPFMQKNFQVSWLLGRVHKKISNDDFTSALTTAVADYRKEVDKLQAETPFGVPYKPHIWGAGWGIQSFGVQQYFLHSGWPEIFGKEYMLNALNFVLGCHPGRNTASFASGVGSRSLTVAYGVNRADGSYIPGGVGSGTSLIRPDFAELKEWPYLWQQTEYVIGGGAENFMFLALAADRLMQRQ